MERPPPSGSTDALTAARALRSAAGFTDRARRADAIWDGIRSLRPRPRDVTRVLETLEDDGIGDVPVPGPEILLASARRLERLASTAEGVDGAPGTGPGRARIPALRADQPTTRKRRRRRHRRRSRS